MADALVSPPVAITAGVVAVALIAVSSNKVKKSDREDIIPLMGVMGAFVFAAQMINFSIPGTGSSGHIIGGILLAALLGPWAAFITLASVLIIQCLIFADGGLMALGCNLINMGAMSCLVGFPLVYRPLAGNSHSKLRISLAAVLASVVSLEAGAILVTAETELSGVTALPATTFLGLMTSIHLAIGLCEGVATALILSFVESYQPSLLFTPDRVKQSITKSLNRRSKIVLTIFGAVALIFALGFTWLASGNPDGLEWSIAKITGSTELGEAFIPATAVIPDYDSTFSGIIGGVIVMVMIWGISAILFRKRKKAVR